jgi:hypothetical protein
MDFLLFMKMEPRRVEILAVFAIICAVMACSFVMARNADLNTLNEPSVRNIVFHAYQGLLFEFIGLFWAAVALLPRRIQKDRFYAIELPRIALYANLLFVLGALLIMSCDVSRALHASATSGADFNQLR